MRRFWGTIIGCLGSIVVAWVVHAVPSFGVGARRVAPLWGAATAAMHAHALALLIVASAVFVASLVAIALIAVHWENGPWLDPLGYASIGSMLIVCACVAIIRWQEIVALVLALIAGVLYLHAGRRFALVVRVLRAG